MYANEGDDLLWGGEGDDLMDGWFGNDTASYVDAAAAVTVDLRTDGNGIAYVSGGAGNDGVLDPARQRRFDGERFRALAEVT